MLSIKSSGLILAAFVLALLPLNQRAEAQTITFDDTFTSPLEPQDEGFVIEYHTPTLGPPVAFRTQNFAFGGQTQPVTGATATFPELNVVYDPSLCSTFLGVTCVDNGTQFLVVVEPISSQTVFGGLHRLRSFEASQLFGGGGCPAVNCGDDLPDATVIQVFGIRGGVIVAQETFALSANFQTFVLTDPDWMRVARVVFVPLDANGDPGGMAIDNLRVQNSASADFDGDARSDITVFRPSNGAWYMLQSTSEFADSEFHIWGQPGDMPVQGDFDGDGKKDLVNFRPSNGAWYIRTSSTNFTEFTFHFWGQDGDIPVQADFDDDGKADLVVYRPSNGAWYIRKSSTNFTDFTFYIWGQPGDIPMPGEFDGDGKTDLVVYRPSNGAWYIKKSSTNFNDFVFYIWGQPGDIPVPGDFDGDTRNDIVVYRPSNGAWYILRSSSNFTGFVYYIWGQPDDTPVPGDFDGDGRTDAVVYRPSNGAWYILRSTTNYTGFVYYLWGGQMGDIPVPTRP